MLYFLKKLFSFIVTDYKIYINFLGFKINLKRKAIKKVQEKYKDCSAFDLPKATGNLRKLQMAELKVLKLFDAFCSENGLEYWLEHGTMLGAYRNKGFITWDDDIDVGMMRDDYEKFINLIFEQKKELHKDLKIIFETNGRHLCLMKIIHKKLDCIQFDIFPYDYFYKKTDSTEKYNMTKFLIDLSNKKNYSPFRFFYIFNPKKVIENYKKITKEKILQGNIPNKKAEPSIFCGIDFPYFARKCLIYDYEDFFPLKRLPFEDCEFLCPNKTQRILEFLFEDYKAMPNNPYPHHYGSENVSKKVERELDKFLQIKK